MVQAAGRATHEDVDVAAERRRVEGGDADSNSLCLKNLHKAYKAKVLSFLYKGLPPLKQPSYFAFQRMTCIVKCIASVHTVHLSCWHAARCTFLLCTACYACRQGGKICIGVTSCWHW